MHRLCLNKKRIKTAECSLEKLKNDSPVIHFLFKHNLCILSMMTGFLIKDFPRQVSNNIEDRRLQFILLFLLVIIIISVFGTAILNSVDTTLLIGVYVAIFVGYELYCVLSDFMPDKDGSNDTTKLFKYGIFGPLTPLMYIVLFLIRLVWAISLIALTALVNLIYILLMSFLAIPLYSKSFLGAFSDVNKFIWKSKKEMDMKEAIITNMYRYIFEICLIVTLCYSMGDYASSLDESFLQTIMTILCSVIIFVILFIIYQRYLMNGSLSKIVDEPELVINRKSSMNDDRSIDTNSSMDDSGSIDTNSSMDDDSGSIDTNSSMDDNTSFDIDEGIKSEDTNNAIVSKTL